MRRAWRTLHQVLGLGAGLVLMVMGVTGALMSFEEEMMLAASTGIMTVTPHGERLSPDALIERLRQERPDLVTTEIEVRAEPGRSDRVRFLAAGGGRASRQDLYVDPYDGSILGPARLSEFFAAVRRLHRWLLLPGGGEGPGRQITGIAAMALVVLSLSGLYLRWPPRAANWRAWLKLDLRRPGRPLWWSLHAKIGTWVLPVYLLSALTGLWWSYDWYRAGATWLLTGPPNTQREERPRPEGSRASISRPTLDPAWGAFVADTPFRTALVTVPRGAGEIRIRSVGPDAPNPHAWDEARYDPATGRRTRQEAYSGKTLGQAIAGNVLEVHRGRFFGLAGTLVVMLAALLLPGFAVTGLLLYLGRRRGTRRGATAGARNVAATRASANAG